MENYTIYGLLYETCSGNQLTAVCAGENAQKAIGFLEKSLEEQGYKPEAIKNMGIIAKKTDFTSQKEGLIFGHNSFTDNLL